MGIFRSYPRPTRRVYIPTLTPAATPASLVYRKQHLPLRFFDRTHPGYYKKRAYLKPLSTLTARNSLPYRAKQDLTRFFGVDQARYIRKTQYLPSVTAAPTTSLPYNKPPDLQAFFRQERQYYRKQPYLAPLSKTAISSLLYRTTKPELEIFRQRDALKAFFYKPQKQYRLSSTVTPPPGVGSLPYQPKRVDINRFYPDLAIYYRQKRFDLKPLFPAPPPRGTAIRMTPNPSDHYLTPLVKKREMVPNPSNRRMKINRT